MSKTMMRTSAMTQAKMKLKIMKKITTTATMTMKNVNLTKSQTTMIWMEKMMTIMTKKMKM